MKASTITTPRPPVVGERLSGFQTGGAVATQPVKQAKAQPDGSFAVATTSGSKFRMVITPPGLPALRR